MGDEPVKTLVILTDENSIATERCPRYWMSLIQCACKLRGKSGHLLAVKSWLAVQIKNEKGPRKEGHKSPKPKAASCSLQT